MNKIIIIIFVILSLVLVRDGNACKLAAYDDGLIVNLSKIDRELWRTRAQEKLIELQNYITTIGDKNQSIQDRELAIKSAIRLFVPGAKMEVSSTTTGRISNYPINVYMNRLRALPYTQVVITFYQVAYISDLQRSPDGNYYATATIYQEFRGYYGDALGYSDKTTKTVQIILQYVDNEFYQRKMWELMLGDVKVSETRKI